MSQKSLKKKEKNKFYVCQGCEKIFDSKQKLNEHQIKNLYEFYYEYIDGRYKCKICDKMFSNYEVYVKHWKQSIDHEDEAYYDFIYSYEDKKDKSNWITRPIHKLLVAKHIKHDSEKKMLKTGKDFTKLLAKELNFAYLYDDYNVVEIVGPPGHGKSVCGLWLAVWMQIRGLETYGRIPEIFISFSEDETQEYMRIAKRGDIIIQDESPQLVGAGKNWFRSNLQNLMDTMRAANIHFIFISPRVDAIGELNQQVILEAYARNFINRENKFAMFDRERSALGWVIIPVLDKKDPLMIRYRKMKYANIEKLKAEGGSKSGGGSLKDKHQRDVDKVFDYITLSDLYDKDYIRYMPMEEVLGVAYELVTGTTSYVKTVARIVKKNIADWCSTGMSERGIRKIVSTVRKGKVYRFVNTENIEDFEILKDIYNKSMKELYLIEYPGEQVPYVFKNDIIVYDENKDSYVKNDKVDFEKYKDVSDKNVKIAIGRGFFALYYMAGQTGDSSAEYINEILGLAYNRENYINVYLNAYRECIYLATAGELVVRDWFYPQAKHESGQNKPDLVDAKYIVEVKTRYLTDKRNIDTIVFKDGGSYIYDYVEREFPIKVVRVYYGKRGVRSVAYVEFYRMDYDEIEEDVE